MREGWAEWSSYGLSDFLMFSARTYYRQFELMNRELWPLPVLALGVGAAIVACMLRMRPAGPRIALALLALSWLCVAWAYLLERHADINTGAPYFALGFCIQAGLLGWMALRRPAAPPSAGIAGRLAMLLVLIALVVLPALAPANGRGWWQAEVFGLAPDPTVAATLGVLLFWRAHWVLWVIPLLWCAISAATLMTLRAPLPWLLPALACAAIAGSLWHWAGRRRLR